MNDVLLVLHFFGLMMGAAGGLGNMVVAITANSAPPERAGVLRSLGPRLGRLSLAGLVLMWITGVIMVWTAWGGIDNLPSLFWVKFIFVLTLTVAAVAVEFTYGQIKVGNAAAARRLPLLGPAAGLSSLLAVIFAVLAFH